jgi:CRISPR/Cas system CSM-associated protein Csm3 (group 7 of RAMP superfamily)
MARSIAEKLKVTGTLVTQAPLSVGGMGGDVDVDLALARDGQGRLYVPGTSLTGPIREWVRRAFDETLADLLFGYQNDDKGNASYAIVDDVIIDIPEDFIEVRDGVGIDRKLGTAAERAKYDRAVLPRGTRFPFAMSVELPLNLEDRLRLKSCVGHLLQAMQEKKKLGLGAARTRGLGWICLESLSVEAEDWATRCGILKVLRGSGSKVTLSDLIQSQPAPKVLPRLDIVIEWMAKGPVMVKAAAEGVAVDMLPLVSRMGSDRYALVLPGSGIKGALRGQAERIIRTVLDLDVTGDFLKDVQVPLVEYIFGSAKSQKDRGRKDNEVEETEEKPKSGKPAGKGALLVDDCYGTNAFSRVQWNDITAAKDEFALRSTLNAAGLTKTQQAFHVAVDRWTGGAAEHFLYNILEPLGCEWEPMRLSLDLDRLPEDLGLPALALLFLLMRDLAGESIPIGFAANRGMGIIKISNITLTGSGLNGKLSPLDGTHPLSSVDFPGVDKTFLANLESVWTTWIDQTVAQGQGEG